MNPYKALPLNIVTCTSLINPKVIGKKVNIPKSDLNDKGCWKKFRA
jgi:hypothetical protein